MVIGGVSNDIVSLKTPRAPFFSKFFVWKIKFELLPPLTDILIFSLCFMSHINDILVFEDSWLVPVILKSHFLGLNKKDNKSIVKDEL